MTYAEAIKQARTDSKLTMVEFGERVGVTKQAVFNWENAVCKPNDEQRLKLHDEFGIAYDVYFCP